MSNSTISIQEQVLMLGEYLSQKYEFRHNVLSNVFELRDIESSDSSFRPLTREAMNSISKRVKQDGLEIANLRQNIEEHIYSEETLKYDPVGEYLGALPQWDGHNHIGDLFGRIPGVTTEQQYFMSVWLRSMVAHWKGMDMLHGNECVVTLIGAQGCGKSTWCARLLPVSLRNYYLDHINLGNKFDKEMALTNNLLVNLDELDQIKPGQHAQLKHALSKAMVNGRPIYGREQNCRRRYASFVSTTNNVHPLSDRTGNRRYLCVQIPDGDLIDNDSPIDYEQLYAQVVHELEVSKMRFWFTNEEVKRIEALNLDFQFIPDLESMIGYCFRAPREGEQVKPIITKDIVEMIATEFPTVKVNMSTSVKVGRILKMQHFEGKAMTHGHAYFVVPRRVANMKKGGDA